LGGFLRPEVNEEDLKRNERAPGREERTGMYAEASAGGWSGAAGSRDAEAKSSSPQRMNVTTPDWVVFLCPEALEEDLNH